MNFTLAHFSDLHLGPLPPGAAWRNFRAKRLLGALSWHLRRKHLHLPAIANALRADIQAAKPEHVAFTGDAVNIASPAEFPPLRRWFEDFGPPEWLSVIPGNHDAYVKADPQKTLELFQPYMMGDMRATLPFPYVRLRRTVALIGLNSAIPRGFLSAEGRLGHQQCEALRQRLAELKVKGFYRLVMIHHPPGPGIATRLRSLIDAPELTDILCEAGAELVIHGHDHKREFHWLNNGRASVPAIGVPSASMSAAHGHPAEWNLYEISRIGGRWRTDVRIRQWHAPDNGFRPAGTFTLGDAA